MNKFLIIFIVAILGIALGYIFLNKNGNQVQTSSNLITTNNITSSTSKEISLSEISSHASSSNCWMAIDGKVYDVTQYIPRHPDGNSILKGCGQDATAMFNEVRKHQGKATWQLTEYQIGILK